MALLLELVSSASGPRGKGCFNELPSRAARDGDFEKGDHATFPAGRIGDARSPLCQRSARSRSYEVQRPVPHSFCQCAQMCAALTRWRWGSAATSVA